MSYLVMTEPSASFITASCNSPVCNCPSANSQLKQWFQTGLLEAATAGVTAGVVGADPSVGLCSIKRAYSSCCDPDVGVLRYLLTTDAMTVTVGGLLPGVPLQRQQSK